MAAPFEEWYKSMPIITKSYMTACVITSLAVQLDVLHPLDLYLSFPLVTQKLEIWRLITNFFFFDRFGLNFLFHMYFLVKHSRMLEEGSFRGRTADFFFMFIFGASLLIFLDFIFYRWIAAKLMFLAPSLPFMVVYIWSRRNPSVVLSFLGLFDFSAPYLPWVILGFGYFLGQSPVFDLMGIAVGHLYYHLVDVYPQQSGRTLLKTPAFLKALFDTPVPVRE